MSTQATNARPFGSGRKLYLATLSLIALASVLWVYWPTLASTAQFWANDPQYSHGYLVPLFAVSLLWARRGRLAPAEVRPSFVGVPVLLTGMALFLVGSYYFFPWIEAASLTVVLAGVCLLIGGRAAWRWAWPAIGFLVFMFPLPYRVAAAMGGTLQHIATLASTFLLQTLGFPAIAEGNVILLNEHEIGIVEACSGLRMLVVFFALSTAVALMIRRRPWERGLIIASAVPIALLSNLVRIVVTGILYDSAHSDWAEAFFHDLAGWFMMPLGLCLLWLELQVLDRLFIDVPATGLSRRVSSRPLPA